MAYTFNPFTGTFDNAPSTLKGDSAYSTLCAISGDLVTYDYLHDGFLPLSGGTVTGNLSVEGSFEVGTNAVATIYAEGTLVGINTETPNEELTVVGDISSSSVIYASGGNSNIWNESYSLIQSNSASWVSDSTADTEVRALTSGWVGGNEAYTNLVANSAAYLSAVDLSFLSVSANWDSVYNTVQSNSATNWNYQGTDIKSLTGNWESTYTTFKDVSSTFLTSETDSQTLSFDETTKDLSISNGNTVSLSSLNGTSGNYLPLSGGTVTGNLSVEGNFEVGPSSGSITLFISGDRVGINTETPNEELTVVGNISASNIIYADGGNSVSWNEVFTSYSSNSSTFLTSETDSQTLSFNEVTKDLSISNGNTVSLSSFDVVLGSYLPLSGGTMTGKLVASADDSFSKLNIGGSLSVGAPTTTVNGDVWITNQNRLAYKSNNVVVNLAGLSQQNTFSQPQSIGSTSNASPVFTANNTGSREAAVFTAQGTSPAVRITQNGTGNALTIEDSTNPDATPFIIDALGSVGIGLSSLSGVDAKLTVVGNVSATEVIYASGGNSNIWNSAYNIATAYSAASSTFLTSETDSQTLSFDEGTKDLTISNGNTISLSALVDTIGIDTEVRALTSNWESTYNTVSTLSASWSAADEVLLAQVTNADSVTLNRGDVVYSFGATGSVMSVKLASNSGDSTSATTLGVVNETIIPNGIGYVTVAGRIDNMSFPHPFVDGDILYLGNAPGTFTRVKPVAPEHNVYLGVVERANNGNGIAYIKVQNGYELNEIHDVLITSVSAGQVLRRNNTNNLWINTNDGANWDSVYTTVTAASANWQGTYTNFSANSAVYVKTVATTTPGTSAITTIVAVSALPPTQVPGTLYVLM